MLLRAGKDSFRTLAIARTEAEINQAPDAPSAPEAITEEVHRRLFEVYHGSRGKPLADFPHENRCIFPIPIPPQLYFRIALLSSEIRNQLGDNLFFLKRMRLPRCQIDAMPLPAFHLEEISVYLDMVSWYAECVAGATRKKEMNRSGNLEPTVNHPLRVVDIGLGLLDRMYKYELFDHEEWFQTVVKYPFVYTLILLLHDAIEDQEKYSGKTSEVNIKMKLTESLSVFQPLVPDNIIEMVIQPIKTLDKSNSESMAEYLKSNLENPFTRLAKSSDIIQNSLSTHNDSQKAKYKDHYVKFICDILSSPGMEAQDFFNWNIVNRSLEANPYLAEVFKQCGHRWVCRNITGFPRCKHPHAKDILHFVTPA